MSDSMKSKLSRLAAIKERLSIESDDRELPPVEHLATMMDVIVTAVTENGDVDPDIVKEFSDVAIRLREGKVPTSEMAMWARVLEDELIPAWLEGFGNMVKNLKPNNYHAPLPDHLRPPFELPPHILKELAKLSEGSTVETSVHPCTESRPSDRRRSQE